MGLDISVYRTVTPIPEHDCRARIDDDGTDWEACYYAGHRKTFVYEGFEQSYRGLPVADPPYRIVGGDTRLYGNEWVAAADDSWGFRAGSYSGYNAFRSALASAAWDEDYDKIDWSRVDEYRDKPFFELCWFADNEGTIGPEAAADLARDYDEHKDRIVALLQDDYFEDKFHEWGRAFHDAANTGMIDFH